MSRDPYGGNIWDPSTQHRYKYARSNPVNYIDPSGRGALLELGLDLGGKAAEAAAITYYAHQVRCLYRLDAAMSAVILSEAKDPRFPLPSSHGPDVLKITPARRKLQIQFSRPLVSRSLTTDP